jgi:hypothetical protein
VWLYRTRAGLALRAVGLDATSARRLGMATGVTVFLAFVACSVMAAIAGFYLATQVQPGGREWLVLRRAARGPLPDGDRQRPTPVPAADGVRGDSIGALILLALVLYQAPELVARFRAGWAGVGRLRTRGGEAPAG